MTPQDPLRRPLDEARIEGAREEYQETKRWRERAERAERVLGYLWTGADVDAYRVLGSDGGKICDLFDPIDPLRLDVEAVLESDE